MAFRPVSNAASVIHAIFPGAHINDQHRSAGNTTGKPNDWHHKSYAAVDVRQIPGITFDQFIRQIEGHGYHIIEKRDEAAHPIPGVTTGPHWHVVIGEG